MTTRWLAVAVALVVAMSARADEGNPMIDYVGFRDAVGEVGPLREERRVSEAEFLRLADLPDTVILDARSSEKYALLHVRGAKNLSLPDVTEAELAALIPNKDSRVLIYCNNNFDNADEAFPSKAIQVSLNLLTYTTLHAYGYTNVWELGPYVDIDKTDIPFEGTDAPRARAQALAPR
jgi:hypothetical protein